MEQDKPKIPPITDQEIDALLYEAKGEPREAIRMLLHDLAQFAMSYVKRCRTVQLVCFNRF